MYTKQSKKMIPIDILEILKQYTDEDHRLSQKDIEKILLEKYDLKVDRRSVKRGIMDLIDMGLDIQYREIPRKFKDKSTGFDEDQTIMTDFYLERDFSDCEIRLLIDELLDSKYIPVHQRRQLINKLESLSSVYFRKNRPSDFNFPDESVQSNQLFFTLDVVEDAIANNNMVSFRYPRFVVGVKGSVETVYEMYCVVPVNMKVIDGDYILEYYGEGPDELFLRLDYIKDIRIADKNKGKGRDYSARNDSFEKRTVSFRTTESMLPIFVDEFGSKSIRVEEDGDEIILDVKMPEDYVVDFATRYSDQLTVLGPESVKTKVIEKLQAGLSRYGSVA